MVTVVEMPGGRTKAASYTGPAGKETQKGRNLAKNRSMRWEGATDVGCVVTPEERKFQGV